jgi:hypothetical protein
MNADQEERTKHVLRRAYEIGIISADEFVRLHEFEESEEDPRDAEIERLTTENETLRAGIARCCVGWDDLPYQDQRGAIVTRLEELLGDTDGE